MNRQQLFEELYKQGFDKFTEVGKGFDTSDIINKVPQTTDYIEEKDFEGITVKAGEIVYFDGTHNADELKELIDLVKLDGGLIAVHDTFPPDLMHTKQALCGTAYELVISALEGGATGYTLTDDYGTTVFDSWTEFELLKVDYSELNKDRVNAVDYVPAKESNELEELKEEYKDLTGSRPKGRISIEGLKDKINELRGDI